jgi:hypothetical protein
MGMVTDITAVSKVNPLVGPPTLEKVLGPELQKYFIKIKGIYDLDSLRKMCSDGDKEEFLDTLGVTTAADKKAFRRFFINLDHLAQGSQSCSYPRTALLNILPVIDCQ